jgi:hypothetical protein
MAVSNDDGLSWSTAVDTDIANPGSSCQVRRLKSGLWVLVQARPLRRGLDQAGRFSGRAAAHALSAPAGPVASSERPRGRRDGAGAILK